ncbi:lipopolysaccharide biosynthesis protein [Haloarcula montana]|uniref:lipopolysaccharide biosynthesis protein n=1 Tax=Haloarcula montana TaxID=3111776 RepID=UPI002D785B7C|nr:polysaccharide biosynthesis C-terminal domain-containing protein [Haloarcula sp. GH36]
MTGTRGFFGRFLSLIGPKMLTTVLAVVSTPIIVRLLGPGGYGDYAVLLSMYSLYMIPISSAITEGVQKFVAEERETEAWIERVLQFYFVLAVVLAVVGSAVLVAVTRAGYAAVFGTGFTPYLYILAGFVLVGQCRGFAMHTLLGFGLERVNGPLGVVKKAVTVVVGIGLVVSGLGVVGMLVGHIAANALVAVVAGGVILRRVSVRRLFDVPRSLPVREFLSFNGLNIVLVLLVMSLFHVDVVMVRTLVGGEATGYYKAALSLAEYIWIVPMVLQTMLLHSSSSLWSEQATEQITRIAGRVTRYTTLLVLLLAVGLGTLADRVVPLYYGEPFAVATTPLLLLLPGTVGFAVARPLQAICQGSGQLKTVIVAVGVAAVGNLVLNAVLIRAYGINGAAVATSIAYGSMFLLLVWASWRIGYDPLVDLRPVRVLLTIVVSALVIGGLDRLIGADIVALLVVPVVGLGVFTATALVTGAVDVEETVEILAKVPVPFEFDITPDR